MCRCMPEQTGVRAPAFRPVGGEIIKQSSLDTAKQTRAARAKIRVGSTIRNPECQTGCNLPRRGPRKTWEITIRHACLLSNQRTTDCGPGSVHQGNGQATLCTYVSSVLHRSVRKSTAVSTTTASNIFQVQLSTVGSGIHVQTERLEHRKRHLPRAKKARRAYPSLQVLLSDAVEVSIDDLASLRRWAIEVHRHPLGRQK